MDLDISVVIPCYGPHLQYIDSTLSNIIDQTSLPKEIILISSETDDKTKQEIVNKYSSLFENKNIIFKVINTTLQQYAGINRNAGAMLATSEYIMFINANDIIHPQKIEITKYFLKRYQPNMLLHSYTNNPSETFNQKIDYINAKIIPNETLYTYTFKIPARRSRGAELKGRTTTVIKLNSTNKVPHHGYPTIKRSLMNTYKYSNLRQGQDSLFIRDILWSVGNVLYIDLELVSHYCNSVNITFPKTDGKTILQIYQLVYDVNNLLTSENIPYWIDGGTLLGAIRHKGIIPWDDDADIDIEEKYSDNVYSLKNKLIAIGYDITKSFFGYKIFPVNGIPLQQYDYKFPFLDIFIVVCKDSVYRYSNAAAQKIWGKCLFKINEVHPIKKYVFGEMELYGPANPTPYLNKLYGSDWLNVAYRQADHLNLKRLKKTRITLSAADKEPAYPTGPLNERSEL